MLGTFSWGVITGIAMVQSGMSVAQAVGMTLLVFSGTAQLAALPLMVSGASLWLIAFTTLLTSLRFPVYSASISREFSRLPPWLRLRVGYLTTDGGLAAYNLLPARQRRVQRTALYLGFNVPVWLVWQVGSLLGIALVALMPDSRDLSYLGVLAVLAMITQLMGARLSGPTVLVALAVVLIGANWPYRAGMLLAIACGVLAPLAIELVRERGRPQA